MPFPHPAQLIAAVRARFVGDVIDPELVPTPEEARNGRLLQAEAPFASLLFGAQSFYALFAIQLGASNFLVGWLTSGQALLNLLIGIPIARLVERHSRQFKLPLAAAALLMRVFTIAIVIIPLLPAAARPWVLVILVSMAAIPNTLWMVSFWATFGEIFRSRLIPRIIGGRWAVFNISTVVQMLLLGWIIDLLPFSRRIIRSSFCP